MSLLEAAGLAAASLLVAGGEPFFGSFLASPGINMCIEQFIKTSYGRPKFQKYGTGTFLAFCVPEIFNKIR